MDRLSVIGAGSWGTALAIVLSPGYDRVSLWAHEPGLATRMAGTRENDLFLPGFHLPANVEPTAVIEEAIEGSTTILGVMPSRFARRVYQAILPVSDPNMRFVSATKGIEAGALLRMSEVIAEVFSPRFEPRVAVLSGPTFAREIARGDPAAVVISSSSASLAADIQREFSRPTFRLYRNYDPIGVEIGAAFKNTIAIGAGICQGLGLGSNTQAALITRGLAEITRLAVAMGGCAATLAGLAGLGDLVLTCTGELSRNRQVGLELARGRNLAEIVASMQMIAEGVETTACAAPLARKFGVEMPIVDQLASLLRGEQSPRQAIRDLMERSLKVEVV